DRQPPPRPPQSTIPQLTSLLINNAGGLRVALPEASEALDSTLRDLKARIAALEASRTSYEKIVDAIKAFG
ncbi:hypothetical protein OSH39_10105, partial [Mycobacterium ulcerans]|nr:hypothetical protein [Mycobacterium ulcerans]MEB3907955.1 hypothetical protein [Mycobacterium ulcerans]MEB3918254.1 hypothetical protein [Mycobacterium ulcerans]MEB3922312.1 hypothetical protein [Mycobacterium ulcerans]MEB3926446.1 hypothetical protein [Mycobacterium ulcerans]